MVVVWASNCSAWRMRQEDPEFEGSLDYTVALVPFQNHILTVLPVIA